jgi:hypothetical protein
MDAGELLDRAKAAYGTGVNQYREAMLETGRLLHEYVLVSLARADGLTVGQRARKGVTRKAIVQTAADSLGVCPIRVNHLISAAMVVRLLAGGGTAGNLAWAAVRFFQVFLTRTRGVITPDGRKVPPEKASSYETWQVRKGFEKSAPALFRRAADENWTQRRVLDECRALSRRGLGLSKREALKPVAPSVLDAMRRSASRASPGDVANACLDVVRASEDPWQVAQRLIAELQRIPRPRMKAV